ncbi:MAG: BglII/BstYI family type II restriction endonuclease [Candidatus Latescibacterota bacterium]|jgi:hypothetical protein
MDALLRHVVRKSTFKEGFAIPKDFEEWISAPNKGCKREICLIFDGYRIPATLRRIDNEQMSVQVKYENNTGQPFRYWLASIFNASLSGCIGEYFEVSRRSDTEFQITAFPRQTTSIDVLNVEQWLFHKGTEEILEHDTPLSEIPALVHKVPFVYDEGQSFYNRAFSVCFEKWDWCSECKVIPQLGLKCDFAKGGIQVEIEFGNARTYYQDFIKFLLGNHYCGIHLGVLIVPTVSFAKHLCEVGRQRAISKGRSKYSGMIDFDKVFRELHFLEFMIPMPIAVAAIGSSAL